MMLAIPRYDLGVCAPPADMRSMVDRAIAGLLLKLTMLLPLVETSIESAKTHCSALASAGSSALASA